MKIENKNLTALVFFMITIAVSMAGAFYIVIQSEIQDRVTQVLAASHQQFQTIQNQQFSQLAKDSELLATNHELVAALSDGDGKTIKSVVSNTILLNSGAHFLLFHGNDFQEVKTNFAEENPIRESVQSTINSEDLVNRVLKDGKTIFDYVVLAAELHRMVVNRIQLPEGNNLAVVILIDNVAIQELRLISEALSTNFAIASEALILNSTFPDQGVAVQTFNEIPETATPNEFALGQSKYRGKRYPVISVVKEKPVASIVIGLSDAQLWQPYEDIVNRGGTLCALLSILGLYFWLRFNRRSLSRPLQIINKAIHAIGMGNFPNSLTIKRSDEIGDVAHSLNFAIERLRQAHLQDTLDRERFFAFANCSADWFWETDKEGRLQYVGASCNVDLPAKEEELLNKTFVELFPIDDLGELTEFINPPSKVIEPINDLEVWVTMPNGGRHCLKLNAKPFYQEEVFAGFRGSARDITKTKTDEERLLRLANKDHLTGLSNRLRFMEDLERQIIVAERQNQSGAVLVIDLDRFKSINDSFGHAAGDEVLVQVGSLLRRMSRSIDLTARLSGDEFVITFVNVDTDQACMRAGEMQEQISEMTPMYGGNALSVTASIGIAIFPEHSTNSTELLAKADAAMYTAKNSGRNRVALFSENERTNSELDAQMARKEQIHQAIEKNEVELVLQPIASTNGAGVYRYEVLVRLRNEAGELYMPNDMISTAEQYGLVKKLDRIIVHKAIQFLATISNKDRKTVFSINISGLSLGDPELMKSIEEELVNTALGGDQIVFEVTESAACQDINEARKFIDRIQQLGCQVALDHFGVGFSSFSYLKHLNADMLKIDGGFIRNIQNNKEDQLFVKALVDVAKGMGISTIAEFVETEESLNVVRVLGVDYVQGFHIGKPISTDALNKPSVH